jgi:hypothetical protein
VETNADSEEPLIQNCPECGTAMDVSGVEPLSAVTCPECGAPSVIAATIDHFELVDVIGHGGMGVVYKALDTSLDRHVALKLLRKSSGNPEQIKQLETEAAITASINHPHVVRVFSTGIDHGRFYIAMELVEKGTLDRLIELQGRVAEAQVLEVGIQIASGLRAAQYAGLIHRDVKPGNILFADNHTAKIVDFGLAIFAEDEAKTRGEIWGTPYYVAPEKLDRKPEDFRSDIYSLGGTLFHALAGRPPFEAESASMVALKHLKSQVVSLQAFAPQVSAKTAYVINRTLVKDPDQRYQSYDELIEHLEYARTELQASGGKPKESKRVVLETEADKKAMGWVVLSLIGIVVAGAIAAFFMRGGPGKKGQDLFPAAFQQLADGRTAEAATSLAGVAAQKPDQPWLNWTNLFEGLAQLLAGHRVEANAHFKKVEERGPYSKKAAEKGQANLLVEVAKRMQSDQPINPADFERTNLSNYESVRLLFYGLKNWDLGKYEEAAKLLRQFRQATPGGPDAWIADLKPVAGNFLDEYTAFEMVSNRAKNAKSLDEKKNALNALKSVKGKLEPRAQEIAGKLGADVAKAEKEKWALVAQGKPPDGRYKLLNRKTNKTIDVKDHAKEDGRKLQQLPYGGGDNQKWNFQAQGNGFYLLVGVESGKAIHVPGGETTDGLALVQGNVTKEPTQKWKIEKTDGNYFKFTCEKTGKVLAVNTDANGAPIIQTAFTGAPEQQWKIEGP